MFGKYYSRFAGMCLRGYSHVALSERGSFRLVRAARKLMPRDAWDGEYMVGGGRRMRLDISDYPDCCMAYGLYELTTARLIKSILRPGDHFVDGGANIGYFTLMAAQAVGTSGRVDAFEPQPENRARLVEHLKRNDLSGRVNIHELALGELDSKIEIKFYEGDGVNHGCSSIYERTNATVISATNVSMRRMDQVLVGTSPRLVKLDIEGAEYAAVLGMEGLLKNAECPMHIITECNYSAHANHGALPEDFVKKVLSFNSNYGVYAIGTKLKRLDPNRLAEQTGGRECNLYFRPPNA